MSYVLPTSLPSNCRQAATGLARHLREQAMTTEAIEWTGPQQQCGAMVT